MMGLSYVIYVTHNHNISRSLVGVLIKTNSKIPLGNHDITIATGMVMIATVRGRLDDDNNCLHQPCGCTLTTSKKILYQTAKLPNFATLFSNVSGQMSHWTHIHFPFKLLHDSEIQ